jgi:hypothetical protein
MDHDKAVELAAKAAHEFNNLYCQGIGDPPSPPWEALTGAQHKGILEGAQAVLEGRSDAERHEGWMRVRAAEGWTYGTEKSFDKRTSPIMVPYDQLPARQRAKNANFRAVVLQMFTALEQA